MRFKSVVFPEPKKPVRTVTGIFFDIALDSFARIASVRATRLQERIGFVLDEFATSMQQDEHLLELLPAASRRRERSIRLVLALNLAVMVAEITVGEICGSMALLADGWHMATHVGALGLALAAYAAARRMHARGAFPFGPGKVHALAGFTSALVLLVLAVDMTVESCVRLFAPTTIDFARSLPVAVVGLVVNLASVRILHDDAAVGGLAPGASACGPQCVHELSGHAAPSHDHNHTAALAHVVADALTSALAIAALLAGRHLGIQWLDPLSGLVGAAVIFAWGGGLLRHAGAELVDFEPEPELCEAARALARSACLVDVREVRSWSLGQGRRGALVRVASGSSATADAVRGALSALPFAFLAVEVLEHTEVHDARASATAPNTDPSVSGP
jgi:cation diffusion facilitator family transporter